MEDRNMKSRHIAIIAIASLAIVISSCSKVDDFLGAEPSKSSKKTIQTAEQLDQVLASYTLYFPENPDMALASDDFECSAKVHDAKTGGYFGASQLVHCLWNTENNVDNRYYTWMKEYQKAYYANLVLANIESVTGDEAYKANLAAEAHFLRAYTYFQIALAHTLYYTGSNGAELGITLKNSISFEETSARSTLAETWDFIDADLQEALKITKKFKNSDGKNQTWRGTTVSVKAFAARYYLYRADYAQALKYAQEVLGEYSYLKDYNNPAEMYYLARTDSYNINVGTPEAKTITV